MASAGQFTVLQQHIEELTEERLQLSRGLVAAQRAQQQLGEENAALADKLNEQAKHIDKLNKKVRRAAKGKQAAHRPGQARTGKSSKSRWPPCACEQPLSAAKGAAQRASCKARK